jgi:hypothetical protein
MNILTVTGCSHPKAEVQSVNAAAGLLIFRWLDANEHPVDSGNSVATFTPVTPDEDGNYAEPSDETLIAAIEAA